MLKPKSYSLIEGNQTIVVLCPLGYCFSLTIHVALDSPNTYKNEPEEMHCGMT